MSHIISIFRYEGDISFQGRLHNPIEGGTWSTILSKPQGYVVPDGANFSTLFVPSIDMKVF
jgi:hypothetical protein